MKKIIFSFWCCILFLACNNSAIEQQKKTAPTSSDYEIGLALIESSNCLSCHKIDEKLTGPSYKEIANKYANTPQNIKMLAQKIIKGSQGVWGAMVMIPNPNLKEEDAEQMAKYILNLKY